MQMLDASHFELATTPLAGRFPFRLGATSYVVPADLAPNIGVLKGLVDDVEVVLFESEKYSNLPAASVIEVMAQAGLSHNLTYTIHLPLDIDPGAVEHAERRRSVNQCLRIMSLVKPLNLFAFVMHLPLTPHLSLSDGALNEWQNRCKDTISEILVRSGVQSTDICVENLSYPYMHAFPIVEALNLSVCFDVGHVLLNRYELQRYYDLYWEKTRVIHLHGLIGDRDHQSLSNLPQPILSDLVTRISSSCVPRVLTMEVFGTDDFLSSMAVMKGFAKCTA